MCHNFGICKGLDKLFRCSAPGPSQAYSSLFIIKSFSPNSQQSNSLIQRSKSQVQLTRIVAAFACRCISCTVI